jgi:hypothetical protein
MRGRAKTLKSRITEFTEAACSGTQRARSTATPFRRSGWKSERIVGARINAHDRRGGSDVECDSSREHGVQF